MRPENDSEPDFDSREEAVPEEVGFRRQMFRATYEYREVEIAAADSALEELNALGAQAWEVVAVVGDMLILRRVNGMQEWEAETEVMKQEPG